jgi:hypothetical protein
MTRPNEISPLHIARMLPSYPNLPALKAEHTDRMPSQRPRRNVFHRGCHCHDE